MELGGKFFSTLDIKRGQYALARQVRKAPIPVTLKGYIVEVVNQDAISTEFRLEITNVKTGDFDALDCQAKTRNNPIN